LDQRSYPEFNFKADYNTGSDSPIQEFLIPALSLATKYDRSVGYFSSALIGIIPHAFSDFAERGGKMRLICSPKLSENDANQLSTLASRTSLFEELDLALADLDKPSMLKNPLDLFSALIKSGTLEIKFAVPYSDVGMHHQKMGIFEDQLDNKISFTGSNNESIFGWVQGRNFEEFVVFRNWHDQNEEERVSKHILNFELLWENRMPGLDIFPYESGLKFIEVRKELDGDLAEAKSRVKEWVSSWTPSKINGSKQLLPFQKAVIKDWENKGKVGIVSFATGAGKTITALSAIADWLVQNEESRVLVIVPTISLKTQWLKEISDFARLSKFGILEAGGENSFETWGDLLNIATDPTYFMGNQIVVAVIDTALKEKFFSRVSWGSHLMLVVDEVHGIGRRSGRDFLEAVNAGAILGLSATPDRFRDPDGTAEIRSVFGNDLEPVIDIKAAQMLDRLVEYTYNYIPVMLEEEEEFEYLKLTKEIRQLAAIEKSQGSKWTESERLSRLRMARARIVKKASNKSSAVAKQISDLYIDGQSWIVFCEDMEQLIELKNHLSLLKPLTYFQSSDGNPEETLAYFVKKGGIMLAIKMLDEGVDIPSVDHAFIVASSQNPRQYVQRRGRVLRKNPFKPKGVAHIWDVIVLNRNGKSIDTAELNRGMTFALDAMNKSIFSTLENLRNTQDDEPEDSELEMTTGGSHE
jgi:superfamily II DNA or RNA helicase